MEVTYSPSSSSNETPDDSKSPKKMLPGKQMPITPKIPYVPKELRYVCGVVDCGVQVGTEQALREHLITTHKYTEHFKCKHCSYRDNSLHIDKLIEHLANHKRHVYQCGACSTVLPRRHAVDRHIYEKHATQDVDVIIHRRGDQSVNTVKSEARWFKSGK